MKLRNKIFSSSLALVTALSMLPMNVQARSTTHTVERGEILLSIANQYGVTVEELRVWNGLVTDMIFVGDVLVVDGTAVSATTSAVGGSSSASAAGAHTVGPGDTLSGIAARYGVSVDQLRAWNGLTSDWLFVGNVLAVNANSTAVTNVTTPYYVPTTSTSGYHTVSPGETLETIANAYGVSVYDLYAWNGLGSDWLFVGDVLSVNGYASGAYSSNVSYYTPTVNPKGNYTVVSGDNLHDLAIRYGTTVNEIMAINGLYSTYLNVGDVLEIPGAGQAGSETRLGTTDGEKTTETDKEEAEKEEKKDLPEGVKAIHKVVEGDNLFRIANRYNVTVFNLRNWNNLAEDATIQVGDELDIREAAYEPKKHKVIEGETLVSIAETYETTTDLLREWNELTNDEVEVGKEIIVSNPKPLLHDVQTGETIISLATKYGVSEADLREWNELPANAIVLNGKILVSNPKKATPNLLQAAPLETTTDETTSVEETTQAQ